MPSTKPLQRLVRNTRERLDLKPLGCGADELASALERQLLAFRDISKYYGIAGTPVSQEHIRHACKTCELHACTALSFVLCLLDCPCPQSLQEMSAALVHSLRSCGTLLVLIATLMFGYSMIGVEVFGGKFYSCRYCTAADRLTMLDNPFTATKRFRTPRKCVGRNLLLSNSNTNKITRGTSTASTSN